MATNFKNSVEVDGYLSISSGNWIQVPDGTTAQRPGSPQVGMFRYNTTTAEFEGYFGSPAAWGAIGGGGGGGTVTEAFKTFAVSGQTSIVADGPTDTLTVAAGNNISLTTDASTDTLTIASTGGSGGGTVTIQRNNYTGDGSTVAYGVSSTIISENNIQIYLDGVYQDKDGFTTAGSTVTFGTAPPATTEIEIMHYVAVDGVIEVDEFVGDGTTTAFATSLSIINEDATQVYVSGVYQSKLTYGTTGNVVSFTTAPPNGANIEIVHIKALALSGFNKNNFVGTGSQTAFTLNTTVNEENMTFVFLEGIYQDKSTYGISGSTLTFATAPQSGYNVEVMVLGAISASTNALYTDTFTADGTETDYTLGITPVDLNAIEVYLNGLYQNVATLTLAANVVTFATPPPSGIIIEIRSVGFLNSGGTLAPATLIGGTGIEVITNSPNNFTINNTLVDVTVSFNAPTGQSLTYTTPAGSSGQAGSIFTSTTFTVTKAGSILSGTAVITGLPAGITSTQSYNNTAVGNILTITLSGVYPSANSLGTNLVVSNLTAVAPPPLTVDYLVVAGGGGSNSGGGGAGGYLTNYGGTALTLASSTNYPVTVGAGGVGATHQSATSVTSGSNSIFSSFVTTGGGRSGLTDAGLPNRNGATGGSGGGGSGDGGGSSGGSGNNPSTTPSQGNNGGSAPTNAPYPGGGGGGAGGVGGTASGQTGGAGGLGLANSITGTSTFYAGGGGGGAAFSTAQGYPGQTGGTGGSGVGGNGGSNASGGDGAANTGSGGGGFGDYTIAKNYTGGTGGSGVVIVRYPSVYTISGLSGTTTTVGTDSVTTFTTGTGNIQFN